MGFSGSGAVSDLSEATDSFGGAGSSEAGGCKLAVISGADGGASGFAATAFGDFRIRLMMAGNVGFGVREAEDGLFVGGGVFRSGSGLGNSSSGARVLEVGEELSEVGVPGCFAVGARAGEEAAVFVSGVPAGLTDFGFDAAAESLSAALDCFQ